MKKFIVTILIFSLFCPILPVEKAEAVAPFLCAIKLAADTSPSWVPWVAGFLGFSTVVVATDEVIDARREHKEKEKAFRYMERHPEEWKDRHPEWDIYEEEFQFYLEEK